MTDLDPLTLAHLVDWRSRQLKAVIRLAINGRSHGEPVPGTTPAIRRVIAGLTSDITTRATTTTRRRALHYWWHADRAANHLVTWTGQHVAAAYDRLTEAEQRR